MESQDARVPGPVLFARYAFSPNHLGLCGPDDWPALLQLGAQGRDHAQLRELAQGFAGAYPYLQLIARETGIGDPLDRRVVEAYWLGTPLARQVPATSFAASLETRFRDRVPGTEWGWLVRKPEAGALPVHAFHVLDVFPRIGLMRGSGGPPADVMRVLDGCRIRWGEVIAVAGPELLVRASHLELREGKLVVGEPLPESVLRWQDGQGFVTGIAAGDRVSIHWGWACDRLDPRQYAALVSGTRRHLEIANQTL